jgi:hypothetical protein
MNCSKDPKFALIDSASAYYSKASLSLITYVFNQLDICQLFPGTENGFYQDEVYKTGPDPPLANCEGSVDPPHWEDNADSPHWEEASYTEY